MADQCRVSRELPSLPPAAKDDTSDDALSKLEQDQIDDDETFRKTQWKDLFNFTTRQQIPFLVFAISCSIICGLAVPFNAFILGKVFDAFSKHAAGTTSSDNLRHTVSKYCTYLTALAAGNWILNSIYFSAWIIFGELQAKSARERIFRALLKRNMEWFDKRKNGIGAMVPRLQMQTRELQLSVSQPFGSVIESLATTFFSLGLALYYSWKLTLVILCIVPVVAIGVTLLSGRLQPNVDKQSDKLNEALKYAMSAMTSIETVKSFNGQDMEVWKYTRVARQAASFYVRQVNINSLQLALVSLCTFGMFIQGFWYGSTLLDKGQTPGKVLTTFWSALMACQGFMNFLPQLMVLEKGRAAGAKLRAVMVHGSRGQEEARPDGGLMPEHCAGDIEMKDVSFSYPIRPNELALDGASLFFAAGETTFVIGKSGSGKSTVGQVLSRFYQAKAGRVTVDGNALEDLDVGWLRRNLTLVEQTSVLFEGSIFRNISYGREDFDKVTLEDVKSAAEFALLQETINNMPDTWDTFVGSKGASMSGGQRQRVALARARLRDTSILILDESTSALDYINRTLILEAIRVWRRGKTTIVITHDIAQIQPDDYVYILEKGKVVQDGYRRSMEKVTKSPFQKFVTIKEDEELEEESSDVDAQHSALVRQNSASSVYSSEAESIQDPLDEYFDRDAHVPRYIPSVYVEQRVQPSNRDSMRLPPAMGQFWRMLPPAFSPPSPTANSPIHSSAFEYDDVLKDRPKSIYSRDHEVGLGVMSRDGQRGRPEAIALRTRSRLSATEERKDAGKSSSLEKFVPKMLKRKERQRRKDGQKKALTFRQILSTVWPRLNWIQRILLVIGFTCCFCHAVSTPVFAFVFNKLLTTFYIKQNRKQKAAIYSLAILGISVFDGISNYFAHLLLEYCGMMWIHNVRVDSMRRILDQPRAFFDRPENGVEVLAQSLDYHAEEMRNLLGRFAGSVFVAVLMMGTAIVWSMVSSWKLSLVGLAATPVFYAITTGFSEVGGVQESRLNDADEAATEIFGECFVNIKTVRSLTLEKTLLANYLEATRRILRVGIRRALYCGLFFGLTDSVVFFVTALLFYYGAVLVAEGQFGTPAILQVFTELTTSMTNVNAIVSMIPQMGSSRDTATRLLRLANLPQHASHEAAGTTRIPLIGDIVFHNLSFAYPTRPDAPVLRGINLTIRAGTCVAIVGASGSGKSTIASLLLNLYPAGPPSSSSATALPSSTTPTAPAPATATSITLSGRDIRHLHTPTLRSLITIVSQTPTIFPATVAANITYGLHASDPQNALPHVRAAAHAAGIDDFVMSLPDGYDTTIGEAGVGLSGGQAQRIAIARALVRRPNVLILDEATSALDVENAGVVRETVQRLVRGTREGDGGASGSRAGAGVGQGMTVIIITHAREMMEIAEHVVMLDQGRVVEEGSFGELVKQKGEFARLLRGGLDGEVEAGRVEG